MSQQTRILLATGLAFLFFIPYSYFFTPKPKQIETNTTTLSSTSSPSTDSATQNQVTTTSQAPLSQSAPISTPTDDDTIVKIDSLHYKMYIDKLGRISQVLLKDERFLDKESGKELDLFATVSNPKPLEIRFSDATLNEAAFKTPYTADSQTVDLKDGSKTITLTQQLDNIVIQKIITIHPSGEYEIDIKVPSDIAYFLYSGTPPHTDDEMMAFRGSIVGFGDEKIEKFEAGNFEDRSKIFAGSNFIASTDRYYASIIFLKNGTFESIVSRGIDNNPDTSIRLAGDSKLSGYIGPKEFVALKNIDPKLTAVIDYGMITFFAKPLFLLLMELEELLGNWGWAIVLLTFLVRVVLYPLTYKGMVSMQKLKDLAPKIKELQVKYKDDKQKMQVKMMELYKKHDANPLGGCLPILLQMPIFFAIYMVLYNAIELKGAGWILWVNDLSVMDPYYVLPILMGGSMYLHQVLTPTTFQDPMQEKIFKFLPLIFTFFFLTFPAGLVLYWFVNNVFSIIQQYIINKSFERKRAKKEHGTV